MCSFAERIFCRHYHKATKSGKTLQVYMTTNRYFHSKFGCVVYFVGFCIWVTLSVPVSSKSFWIYKPVTDMWFFRFLLQTIDKISIFWIASTKFTQKNTSYTNSLNFIVISDDSSLSTYENASNYRFEIIQGGNLDRLHVIRFRCQTSTVSISERIAH